MLEGDTEAIDAAVSSTPSELRAIVQAMEETRLALGTGRKACQRVEAPNMIPSRRGLYARRGMRAGEFVRDADVIALRPASALAPADLPRLIGTILPRDLAAGEPFLPTDVAMERAS
jgi:sialic acid synthase SpsE